MPSYYKEAYLQHGKNTNGPFLTEKVELKYCPYYGPLKFNKTGATVSNYKIKYASSWRRVYVSGSFGPYLLVNSYPVAVLFVE